MYKARWGEEEMLKETPAQPQHCGTNQLIFEILDACLCSTSQLILIASAVFVPMTNLISLPRQRTKYQLWSLAMHSHAAHQTVSSCNTVTELIGANGDRFSVRESSESILHKITVDRECQVSRACDCHVILTWATWVPALIYKHVIIMWWSCEHRVLLLWGYFPPPPSFSLSSHSTPSTLKCHSRCPLWDGTQKTICKQKKSASSKLPHLFRRILIPISGLYLMAHKNYLQFSCFLSLL